MTLEFELRNEDYLAFNLQHGRTSEFGRKQAFRARAMTTIACFVVSLLVVSVIAHDPLIGAGWAVAAGIVAWLAFPVSWERALTRNMKRMSDAGAFGIAGPRTLEITDDGFAETGVGPSVSAKWEDLREVVNSAEYLYVYIAPNAAFVIPKRVGDEAIGGVLGEIGKHRPELVDAEKAPASS